MKRKALRIVLLLGFIITICSIVVVAAVRVRNAKESEIHHKIENIPLASSYGDEELTLLKDAVLPERKALKVYLYPEEELLADIQPFVNRMSLLSDQYWRTATILGHYPTENIRYVKTEKGEHYYAVYMTEKGARYYLFFDQQGQAYGYPVYMAKETAYADFQSLKIGDPIEAVEKIDPAAKTYGERFPKLASGQTAEEANRAKDDHMLFTGSYLLTGVHLLKDGVLEIRYAYNDDGGYVIRDMYYDPQFDGRNNVADILGEENVDEHIKAMDYSYEILPKDYIGDEIVVAEVEADTQQPVLAEDVDWEIRLRIDTGVTKDLVFSKDDFKEKSWKRSLRPDMQAGRKIMV